jgi:pyruvate dehydrogenase E2 component (dihydrolipoamide acetyltransferase)
MPTEFKLPDLGEGIHEAEILAIKVKEGDSVKEDQIIFEVETDKAVVEIPSPYVGTVQKIHVKVGDVGRVGNVMITFDTGADKSSSSDTKSNVQNTVAKVAAAAQSKVESGGNGKSNKSINTPEPAFAGSNTANAVNTAGPIPASPATRRLARELGVDLKLVRGSGPAGRILKEDIRGYAEGVPDSHRSSHSTSTLNLGGGQRNFGPPDRSSTYASYSGGKDDKSEGGNFVPFSVPPFELPDFNKYGNVERVPLRSLRRKIAINMAQSWSHVPHVTHFDEIDVTDIERWRLKHEKEVAAAGGKLTLTVLALKAIVAGLHKYLQFNSSLDETKSEIVFKHYFNIGVAVATERGLIVPVVRDVNKKSIFELAQEVTDLAKKTREGKIEIEKLQGGTFTVTNIGAIGGTGMVPMVNFPEVAILGMAKAKQQPVVINGVIEIRTIMPVALSFDHRVADGAEAAYFVNHIKNCLEDPFEFFMETSK